MSRPTASAALARLHEEHPQTRVLHWWGHRFRDTWFFTFAPGTRAPEGDPSWIVVDDGPIGPAYVTDTFDEALDRVRGQA